MSASHAPYTIHVFHRSYFCGKMLAYLRYKEIPHQANYDSLAKVGKKLMTHTGLRQMPVIETFDGIWLQDTTPMIEWFEQRYTETGILTGNPALDFLLRLIEDYADEWLWRPAIYYRWMHREDRYYYKSLFTNEFIGGLWGSNPISRWLGGRLIHRHQRDKFLQGDGMTAANRKHVESIYLNTLNRLEAIFQQQPYLLGGKPSLADFGFFGSMFWHFSNDPTSNRIMQNRAPGVYEWVARMWNAKASRLGEASFAQLDANTLTLWSPILDDICHNYLPYLEHNALEFDKGSTRFDTVIEGYRYPGVHVSPYRTWCRERLQQHFYNLDDADQLRVRDILNQHGGIATLLSRSEIRSQWDPQGIAPRCQPSKIPLKHKLLARFTGSNHVRSRRAWVNSN